MKIRYRSGYKYQLLDGFAIKTDICCGVPIDSRYIILNPNGNLVVRSGYAWDGPSGPAVDTKSFMRASLVHDALYQLMRMGLLSVAWRKQADKLLYSICVTDGMWRWRAGLAYRAVRRFAKGAAMPSNLKKTMEAG